MENRIARLLTKIFSINFLQFLLLNILKKYEKKVFKRITANNNKILYGPFKNLIIPKNIPFLNLHYLLGTYEYWLQKIIINCVKKKKKIIPLKVDEHAARKKYLVDFLKKRNKPYFGTMDDLKRRVRHIRKAERRTKSRVK